jgi:hypothetical protein
MCSRCVEADAQELNVPGEAFVQGREIGLRDGSHLGQLDHHRIERKGRARRHRRMARESKRKGGCGAWGALDLRGSFKRIFTATGSTIRCRRRCTENYCGHFDNIVSMLITRVKVQSSVSFFSDREGFWYSSGFALGSHPQNEHKLLAMIDL